MILHDLETHGSMSNLFLTKNFNKLFIPMMDKLFILAKNKNQNACELLGKFRSHINLKNIDLNLDQPFEAVLPISKKESAEFYKHVLLTIPDNFEKATEMDLNHQSFSVTNHSGFNEKYDLLIPDSEQLKKGMNYKFRELYHNATFLTIKQPNELKLFRSLSRESANSYLTKISKQDTTPEIERKFSSNLNTLGTIALKHSKNNGILVRIIRAITNFWNRKKKTKVYDIKLDNMKYDFLTQMKRKMPRATRAPSEPYPKSKKITLANKKRAKTL